MTMTAVAATHAPITPSIVRSDDGSVVSGSSRSLRRRSKATASAIITSPQITVQMAVKLQIRSARCFACGPCGAAAAVAVAAGAVEPGEQLLALAQMECVLLVLLAFAAAKFRRRARARRSGRERNLLLRFRRDRIGTKRPLLPLATGNNRGNEH